MSDEIQPFEIRANAEWQRPGSTAESQSLRLLAILRALGNSQT